MLKYIYSTYLFECVSQNQTPTANASFLHTHTIPNKCTLYIFWFALLIVLTRERMHHCTVASFASRWITPCSSKRSAMFCKVSSGPLVFISALPRVCITCVCVSLHSSILCVTLGHPLQFKMQCRVL